MWWDNTEKENGDRFQQQTYRLLCREIKERVKAMSERKIKLTELNEVKEFVRAAEQCDFDIDIFYNRVVIDAKSILGILSMDLTRELTVKYGGENMSFENVLSKYGTA